MSVIKKILNWTKNVVFLYFIWILFSLPIITIGASTTAAYSVAFKLIDKKDPPLFSTFLKAFKSNFLEGTLTLICITAAAFICYKLSHHLNPEYEEIYVIIGAVIIILLAYLYSLYIFPITSHFINKFYRNFESSLLLCTHHPVLALSITALTGIYVLIYHFIPSSLIPLAIIGYPVYFWVKSLSCSYMFKKQEELVKKQQAEEEAKLAAKEEESNDDSED